MRAVLIISWLLCCAVSGAAGAQTRPDIIRGKVTGPDSQPLVRANVQVTGLISATSKNAETDAMGFFSVLFPGAEGDYWVTVRAVGYTMRRFQIKRFGEEDVLVADARLDKIVAQTLRPVVAVGRRPAPTAGPDRDIFGGDVRRDLAALGIDLMGDPSALALFLPEAIYTPGLDGGAGSFSLFGLDADQNVFTLNGMIVGPDGLPRDAGISATLTSSPDASRPGGAGGLLDATMGAGGNWIERTVSVTGRSPRIQWSDATTRAVGNQPTWISFGGKLAAPITRSLTSYKVAYQFDDRWFALRSLLDTDPVGLAAAGLSPDSVSALRGALDGLGIPLSVPAFPSRSRTRSGSVIGTFAYSPGGQHSQRFGSVSVVASARGSERSPASSSLLYEMPGHSGRTGSGAGTLSIKHDVLFGRSVFSSTVLGGSLQRSFGDAYLALPNASVRVPSTLDDGSSVVRTVMLGGNPALDRRSAQQTMRLYNALKWVSLSGRYSFTLGTNVSREAFQTDQSSNLLGSYTFNSIADLAAGAPSSFDRLLTRRTQRGAQTDAGLGINAWFKPDSTTDMSAGIRVDGSRYGTRPVRNPLVEQTFGVRNDLVPATIAVSPRISFSRNIGTAPQIAMTAGGMRQPRFRLTGQGGVYQSTPSGSLPNAAIDNTGLPSGIQRLSCTGDVVPIPDWRAALDDPSSIATTCADGSIPGGSPFASTVPSVTLISTHYQGVRRTSAGVGLVGPVFGNRFTLTARVAYARNSHLQRTVDLNFDPTIRFTLADEGGRPVFAPQSAIVPATGRFAAASARQSGAFDRVREIRSDLRGDSRTFTVMLTPLGFHPTFSYNLSYTMQRNRQMVAGSASTVASPLDVAWAQNPFGQTHRIGLDLTGTVHNLVRLSWTMRLASGAPLTPHVQGDVNGDGYANNDRAFVFDPATVRDSGVAAGMATLLESGSSVARACLRDQVGKRSALTPCRGPWMFQGGTALRVLVNPLALRLPQRAAIELEIGNPAGALDLLVHGANDIHGWGRPPAADQTLLYVRGYNAQEQRFVYDVNPRFGATQPRQNLNRAAPVTFTALVRIDVGPSMERQTLTQLLDRGRRTDEPKVTELQLKGSLGRAGVPNPIIAMLQQSDAMQLTMAQVDTLSQLSRWFALHLDSVWTPAVRSLDRLPRDYNQGEAYGIYQAAREKSSDLMIVLAPRVKEMLTPAQLRLLPPLLQAYLDVRYIRAQRSSSVGMSDGMFPLGGPAVGSATGGRIR